MQRFIPEKVLDLFIPVQSDMIPQWNLSFIDQYEVYIPKLSQRDQLVIDLLRQNRTQKEIGDILGVTQGAVASAILKIRRRLFFLDTLHSYGPIDNIKEDLKDLRFNDLELDILTWFVKTTCQSATAEILNRVHNLKGKDRLNQIKVRHRLLRVLQGLEYAQKKNKVYKKYYDILNYAKNNVYMMYEIKLPHFLKKV